MKFRSYLCLAGVLVFLTAGVTHARIFNDHRSGFVDGLAAGGGAYLNRGEALSDQAFVFRYVIGWGFGNRDLVYLDHSFSIGKCSDSSWCMQQVQGFGWQHYWFRTGKIYSLLGLGAMDDRGTEYDLTIGAGYEFRRHLSASLSYIGQRHSGGNTPGRDMMAIHLWYIWY